MSEQWGQSQPQPGGFGQSGGYPGQPQAPGGPQGPYGQQPGAGYGQAPMQPPQGPYGQSPQPGPYGQPQPPGPYGQPADPFGQQPAPQNPYGQPADPFGQQQITPQNPYGQPQGPYAQPGQPGQFGPQPGYGMPGQPGMPGQRPGANRRSLFISGAVVVVIIAAAAIFFATKGSGGGGTKTQAESCASWKSELNTMNNQNPDSAAATVGVLNTDLPVMQGIANDAQSGTFKTQMSKVATDFGSFRGYLQANPDIDLSGDTLPAALQSIFDALNTDVSAVDSTCGIADDSGNSSF